MSCTNSSMSYSTGTQAGTLKLQKPVENKSRSLDTTKSDLLVADPTMDLSSSRNTSPESPDADARSISEAAQHQCVSRSRVDDALTAESFDFSRDCCLLSLRRSSRSQRCSRSRHAPLDRLSLRRSKCQETKLFSFFNS